MWNQTMTDVLFVTVWLCFPQKIGVHMVNKLENPEEQQMKNNIKCWIHSFHMNLFSIRIKPAS